MSVLNPDHLFEQSLKLIVAPPAGPPRQVDIRRAISAAYYGVFHFILTEAADEFVGAGKKAEPRYTLVYRSVDHGRLRDLCAESLKQSMSQKYRKYVPSAGFDANIRAFATALIELQDKRHAADYDPSNRLRTLDAQIAISTGQSAVRRFRNAGAADRLLFLTLLLFAPR